MRLTAIVLAFCQGLSLYLSVPSPANADEAMHRVYAKPIKRPAPTYPSSELRRGQQGWVDLNYVVTTEGEVVDPVVVASSGSAAFERAAKRAVGKFQYEAALVNGEPVQQCRTRVRVSFAIDGSKQAVSRSFHSSYRKVDRLIKAGDLAAAEAKIDKTFSSKGLTNGELSWLWALRARIAGIRGDDDAQMTAIKRAAPSSNSWIPDPLRLGLLKTRFILDIKQHSYSDALETFTALQAIEDDDTGELMAVVEQIESLVQSDQLIFSEAKIGAKDECESCDTQWKYKPLRRAVEIAEVDGELHNIELRCDWQRYVDQAREGVTWQIPESWGDCSVVVHGAPGTTFKLFEIPAAQARL